MRAASDACICQTFHCPIDKMVSAPKHEVVGPDFRDCQRLFLCQPARVLSEDSPGLCSSFTSAAWASKAMPARVRIHGGAAMTMQVLAREFQSLSRRDEQEYSSVILPAGKSRASILSHRGTRLKSSGILTAGRNSGNPDPWRAPCGRSATIATFASGHHRRKRVRLRSCPTLRDEWRDVGMSRDDSGYFSVHGPASSGDRYFYIVDGQQAGCPIRFSSYLPEGVHGPTEIVDHKAFQWTASAGRACRCATTSSTSCTSAHSRLKAHSTQPSEN